jgi:hypothetical protein
LVMPLLDLQINSEPAVGGSSRVIQSAIHCKGSHTVGSPSLDPAWLPSCGPTGRGRGHARGRCSLCRAPSIAGHWRNSIQSFQCRCKVARALQIIVVKGLNGIPAYFVTQRRRESGSGKHQVHIHGQQTGRTGLTTLCARGASRSSVRCSQCAHDAPNCCLLDSPTKVLQACAEGRG